jgi:hypothetical protein
MGDTIMNESLERIFALHVSDCLTCQRDGAGKVYPCSTLAKARTELAEAIAAAEEATVEAILQLPEVSCYSATENAIRALAHTSILANREAAAGEMREALIEAANALDSLWAAIGDALCSGKGIEKKYANGVAREVGEAKVRCQKALNQ